MSSPKLPKIINVLPNDEIILSKIKRKKILELLKKTLKLTKKKKKKALAKF
jgi:hypothetical protein